MEKKKKTVKKCNEGHFDLFFLRLALSMAVVMIYFASINTYSDKSTQTAEYIERLIEKDIDIKKLAEKFTGNSSYIQEDILKSVKRDDIYIDRARKK